jgi:hypothetical protein
MEVQPERKLQPHVLLLTRGPGVFSLDYLIERLVIRVDRLRTAPDVESSAFQACND